MWIKHRRTQTCRCTVALCAFVCVCVWECEWHWKSSVHSVRETRTREREGGWTMTSDFLWVVSFLCCVCFDLCVMIPLMSSQLLSLLSCDCAATAIGDCDCASAIENLYFWFRFSQSERGRERESTELFCANWEKLESMKCRVRLPPIAPTPPWTPFPPGTHTLQWADWLIGSTAVAADCDCNCGCVSFFLCGCCCCCFFFFHCCCCCVSSLTGHRIQLESFSAHFKFDCDCCTVVQNNKKKKKMPSVTVLLQCVLLVNNNNNNDNNNNTHYSLWAF